MLSEEEVKKIRKELHVAFSAIRYQVSCFMARTQWGKRHSKIKCLNQSLQSPIA